MSDKNDTVTDNNKVTCETATERNMTRCPFRALPEKFFGKLTFKFVNGEIQQIIEEKSVKY